MFIRSIFLIIYLKITSIGIFVLTFKTNLLLSFELGTAAIFGFVAPWFGLLVIKYKSSLILSWVFILFVYKLV